MSSSYLIRFAQVHETFRQPELEALAELNDLKLQWLHYSQHVRLVDVFQEQSIQHIQILTAIQSPFAIIALDTTHDERVKQLVSRSVLCLSIHESWGIGVSYDDLHRDVKSKMASIWPQYKEASFRFDIDTFQASNNSAAVKKDIIDSFSYLRFAGRIIMKKPDQVFTVFEEYELHAPSPHMLFFGRWIADSGRKVVNTYDLKKRKYIATTSMDAELSLLTANIAMAAPGKLAYDPFMGTGSFPVSTAAFGSTAFGSDLDGRSIRGKGGRSVAANFEQYGTASRYLGGFSADLTNTPIATRPILDIIICDPPYGVREGLKVLGHHKERLHSEVILRNGIAAHLQDDYVPPKKPYSFTRMLADILDFAATRLVDNGRLCMWMPVASTPEVASELVEDAAEEITANETGTNWMNTSHEYAVPQHPHLQLVSLCTQDFNKWSRRLLTYRKVYEREVDVQALKDYEARRRAKSPSTNERIKADDLNDFRKQYFNGFKQ